MARIVKVELGARSYEIRIAAQSLGQLGALCAGLGLGRNCLLVSDSHVDPLYGPVVEASLKGAGFAVARAIVPAGEAAKSESELFHLYDKALAAGLDRQSFVVALGGGVVGDLAGYVAASFLRGIHLVQVPTSLLAMVDSSVGGKTGINLPQGKNLVGAFHQPVLVLTDADTLKTLPRREYISGLAEVVKYGVIRDAAFFAELEKHSAALTASDPGVLESVIARCCEIKADVVHLDEREGGLRAILNFGHTLGHAIEQATGYGLFLHGEAVAMGMAFACRLSVAVKEFPQADCARVVDLLAKLGLPVGMPAVNWVDVRRAMRVDKKAVGRGLRFVLAGKLGQSVPGCEVPDDALRDTWDSCVA